MSDNLFRRFQSAVTDPVRPLIRPPDKAPLSYADCFALAARFAHVLAHHGVRPDDRIAVQVEKSPNALCLYLACLRIGAVYLPLNT
ncbi:MAG TPA: AMP-binding protein, partial [Rhizomicrobium sp.]|nr:AMP-binding protein [Rhizomicrobium sp.]